MPIDFSSLNTGFEDYTGGMEEDVAPEPSSVIDYSDPRSILTSKNWVNASSRQRLASAPVAFEKFTQALEEDKSRTIRGLNAKGEEVDKPLFDPSGNYNTDGRDYLERARSAFDVAAQMEDGGSGYDSYNKSFLVNDTIGGILTKNQEKRPDRFPDLGAFIQEKQKIVKEGAAAGLTYKEYTDFANAEVKNGEAHLDPENKEMEKAFYAESNKRTFDPSSLGDDVMIGKVGDQYVMNPKNFNQIDKMEEAINGLDLSSADKKMMLVDYRSKVEEHAGKIVNQFAAADAGVLGSIVSSPLRDEFMEAMADPNASSYEFLKANKDRIDKDSYGVGSEIAATFRDAMMATGTGALWLASGGNYTSPAEAWGGLAEDTAGAYSNGKAFEVFGVDINRRDLTELTGQIGSFVAMGGMGALAGKGLTKVGAAGASRYAVNEAGVLLSTVAKTEAAAAAGTRSLGEKTLAGLKSIGTDPEVWLGSLQASGTSFGKTFNQEMNLHGDREKALKAANIEATSDGLSAFIATSVMNRVAPGMGKAFGMGDGTAGGGLIQNLKNRALGRESMEAVKETIENLGGDAGAALRTQFAKDLKGVMDTSAKQLGLKGLGVLGNMGAEAVEEASDEMISDVISSMLDDSKTWTEDVWGNIGTKWQEYVKAGVLGAVGGAMGDASGTVMSPGQTFGKSEGYEIQQAAWNQLKTKVETFKNLDQYEFKGSAAGAKNMAEYIAMPDDKVSVEQKSKALLALARGQAINADFTGAVTPPATSATPSATDPAQEPPAAQGEPATSHQEGTLGHFMEQTNVAAPEGRAWKQGVVMTPSNNPMSFRNGATGSSYVVTPLNLDATEENGSVTANVGSKIVTTKRDGTTTVEYASAAATATFLKKQSRPQKEINGFEARANSETEYDEWTEEQSPASDGDRRQEPAADQTADGALGKPEGDRDSETAGDGGAVAAPVAGAVASGKGVIDDEIDLSPPKVSPANEALPATPAATSNRVVKEDVSEVADMAALPKGTVVRSDNYKSEGNITIDGPLRPRPIDGVMSYPASVNGRGFNLLPAEIASVITPVTPTPAVKPTPLSQSDFKKRFPDGFPSVQELEKLAENLGIDSKVKVRPGAPDAVAKGKAAGESTADDFIQVQLAERIILAERSSGSSQSFSTATPAAETKKPTPPTDENQIEADAKRKADAETNDQGQGLLNQGAAGDSSPAAQVAPKAAKKIGNSITNKNEKIRFGKVEGKPSEVEFVKDAEGKDTGVAVKTNGEVWITDEKLAAIAEENGNDKAKTAAAVEALVKATGAVKLDALPVKSVPDVQERVTQDVTYVVSMKTLEAGEKDSVGGQWTRTASEGRKKTSKPKTAEQLADESADATLGTTDNGDYFYTPPGNSGVSLKVGDVVLIENTEDEVLILDRVENGQWVFRRVNIAGDVTNVMTSRQKTRVFQWNVNRLLSGSKVVKSHLGAIKSGDITDAAMKSIFMEMVELVAPGYKGKIVETVFGKDNSRYLSADIAKGTILVDYKNLKREFKALLKHANLSNDVTNEALATDVARIIGKMVDEEVIHILAAKVLGKAASNKLYREVWEMGDKSPMFRMIVETAKERYPDLNPDPSDDAVDSIFEEENAAFSVIAEVIRKMHQLSTTGSTTEGAIDDSYILQAAIIRDLGKDAGVAPGKVIKFVNMVREMVRRYSNRVKNILWMRWQQGRLPMDQQNVLARLNKAYRDQKIQGDFDYAQESAEQRVTDMEREAVDSYTRWVNDISREHYEAINELKALPNKFPELKLDQVLMADNDTMALRIEPTIRALIEKHNLIDLGAVDEALAFLNTETKDENGDEIYAMSSYRQAMTVAFTKKQVMEAKLAKLDPELVDLVTGMLVAGEGDITMRQEKTGQQGNYIGRVLRLVKDTTTADGYNPTQQLFIAEHVRLKQDESDIRRQIEFIKTAITSREMQDVESIDVTTFNGRIKLMRVLAEDYPGMEVDEIDENLRPDETVRMFESVKGQLLRKIKLKALRSTHLIPEDGVGSKEGPSGFGWKHVKDEWASLKQLRGELAANLANQKAIVSEHTKVSDVPIETLLLPVPDSHRSTEYGRLIDYIRSADDYNTYLKNVINRSLGDFFFNKGGFGVTFANLTRTEGVGADMSFPEYQDSLPAATTAGEVFGVEFKQKGTRIAFHEKRPFAPDGEELSDEQIDERDQIELLIQKAKSNAAFVGRQHFNRVYMDWMLGNFAKNEDYDLYLDTGGFNLKRTEDENDSDRYRVESPESSFKSLNLKTFKDLRRNLGERKGAKTYSEKPLIEFINEVKTLKAWAEKIQNTIGGGMVAEIAGRQTLAGRVKLAINDQFSPKGDNLRVLNNSDGSVSDKGVVAGKTSMEIDGLIPLLTKFESQLMSTLGDYLEVTQSNGMVESTKLKKDVKPADLYAKLALVVYGDNGTGVSARLESANETVQQVRAALKEFKDKNWRRNYEREGSTIQRSDSFQPDNIELLELRDSPKDTRIYSNFLWLTSYHQKTRDYFVSGNFAFEMMREHATVSYGEGRLPELYTNKKWTKVYLQGPEYTEIFKQTGTWPNIPRYAEIQYDNNEKTAGPKSEWPSPKGYPFYMRADAIGNATGSATNPNSFDADPRSRESYDDIVGMLQEGSSLTQAESMLNRAASGVNGRRYWITKWGMAIGANSEGEFSGKAASTFLDDLLRAERDGISRDDRMDLVQRGLVGLFPKAMGFSEDSKREFFKGIYEQFEAAQKSSTFQSSFPEQVAKVQSETAKLEALYEGNVEKVAKAMEDRFDSDQFLVQLGEFKAGFERELLSQAKAGTSLGEAIRAVTLALPTEEMVDVEEDVEVDKDIANPAYTPDVAPGSEEDSPFAPTRKNKEPKTIKVTVKKKRIKKVPKSKLQHNSFSSPEETTAIKSFLESLVTSDNVPVYNASLMAGGIDGVGNSFVSMLVQSLPGKTLVVNPTEQQVARNGLAGIGLKVFVGAGNAPNVIYAPQGQTSPELSSGVAHGAIAQLLTIAAKNESARAEIDRLGRAIEETLDPVFMIEGLYNELSNGRARWTTPGIQAKLFTPGVSGESVINRISKNQAKRESALSGAAVASMAYKTIEPRLSRLTAAEKKRFKKDLATHILKLSEYSSSLGIVKKNGASMSLFPKRTALLVQKKGESEEKIDFDERGTTSRIMLIAELMSNPSAKRYFDKAYVGIDEIGDTLLPRNVEEGLADALRNITRLDNEREMFDSERVEEAQTNSNELAGKEDDANDDEADVDSNETREDNPAIEEMRRRLELGEITAEQEESMREAMLGGGAKAETGDGYLRESFGPNADAVNRRLREMLDIRQAEDAKAEELGLRQDPSNVLLFNGIARVLEFGKLATGEGYQGEQEVRSTDNILNYPNTTNDATKAMVGPLWKQTGDKRPGQIYVGEMRNLTLPKSNGQTAHNIGFSKVRLARAQAAIILGTRAARSVIDPIASEQIAKTLRTSPFTRSFPRIEARIQVTDQLVSDLDAMLPDLGIKQIEQELRDSLEALDKRETEFRKEEVKALGVLAEIKAEVGRLPKERRNQKIKELQEAIKARKDQLELSSKRDKLRKTETINGIEVPVHGGVLNPDAVKGIERLIAKMEQEIANIDSVPAITLDQDDYDNIGLRTQTRDLIVADVLSGVALDSSEDTNAFVRSISNYYDKNPEMDLEKYVEERMGRSFSQGMNGEFKDSLDRIALSTEAARDLIENRTMTDGQLEAIKQAEKVLLRARNGIKQARRELSAIENNEGQTYVGQGYFQGRFGSPAVAPRPGRSDGFAGVNPDTRSIGTNVFLAAPEMDVQRAANDTDETFAAKLEEWGKGWKDVVPADGLSLTAEESAENARRRLARREHYIRAGSVSKALESVVEDYVDDAYRMARGTDENFNEFDPLKVIQEAVGFAKAEQAAASRFFQNAGDAALDANNAGLHAEAIALLTNPKDPNAMDLLTATQKGKVKMLRMPDNHEARVEKVGRLFEMDGERVVLLPQTARERLMRAYPREITKRNVDSSLAGIILDAPSISQRGQSAPSAKDASYFLKGADQKRTETFSGDAFSLTKGKPGTTKGEAATLFKARWLESMQEFLNDRAEPRQRQSKKVDLSGDVSQAAIADSGFMLELLVIAHEDPNLSKDTRDEIFKLLESIDERAIEAPSEGILGTDFVGINSQRILATFSKAFSEIEAAAIQKTIIAGMSMTGKGKELQLSTLQLLHHQDGRIRHNTMRDHAAREANKHLIAFLDYGISIETGRRGYVISKKKASDRIGTAAEKVGNNSLNHTLGYLLAVVRGTDNANGMNKVQAMRGLVRVMGKGFEDLGQFTAAQEKFYKNDVTKYWNGHSLDLSRDNELAAKIQSILNKGGIRQMVKDLRSDDEAGAEAAQARLIQLLQNAVEDNKSAEVEHYSKEVHAVMTDIHNAMLFTTAVLSQDAATDVNDKDRQEWRDSERRATRPTYSSVPLRLSYAAHPDPTEMGQAGMGRYVSDPADIVSFKDASFFGGIGRNEVMGIEKNVFRPIALNGLSSPLSLIDDALYRLNVTPTYEVLRRSFGKTTTNHNIPTVEDGLFLEKVRSLAPEDIAGNTYLQDKAEHEREVLDFQKGMAGITSELEIQIQNDAAISVDNTGGAEALRFLGSAFIVRALGSPLQLWDQTMSPSLGYTAGKLAVGKPKMAATYFKIIGKLMASLATDRKFWRKVRKFIEETEPAVFFRSSDGQDVAKDMLGNQVRYGSKKGRNLLGKALRKYEQFGEKALDLTIGSGERVIASSLFLTELMNELGNNDLNAVLELKGRQVPMTAKNNARVKVNDLMAQSDQSKKASIHHTKTSNPNLNAAWKSLTRFSNHTSSIASNVSVLSMPAIDPLLGKFDSHKWGHVDKENQQEALENVVQSLVQNILFYPLKLKVMVPLVLSIVLNSWGDDDDDEVIRKAQDLTNDLMAPTDDGTWYANAIKALVFGKKRELFQSNKSDEAARSSALAEVMTKSVLEGFQLTPVFGVIAGYSPASAVLQWAVTDPLSESTSAMLTGVEKAVGPYAKNATNVRKYEKSWDENVASVTAPTQMVYDMSSAMKLMVEYQMTSDAEAERGMSLFNSSVYLASELIPGMRELRSYMKDVLKQSGYKDE